MNGESEPEPQQVADEVRNLVDSAGDKGLSGSQVGLLLRAKWPSFSPARLGVATLREFIRSQVTEVRELGRAGGDVIYGLKDVAPKGNRENLETDLDLWRVWISPLSPFGLAVDPTNGNVRRIILGESAPEEIRIGPAPADKHRVIARDFLDASSGALDADARARLAEVLEKSDTRWWEQWNDTLKSISPQISRNWFMFREHALAEALREALKPDGLNDEVRTRAFENIMQSRQRPASKIRRLATPEATELEESANHSRHDLIALVQRVVSRLTEEELRAMSLPLGLVLDSLPEKSKR